MEAAIDLFSSGEICNDLYISGTELVAGYLLSAAVAIPFGIMVGWYKKVSYIFDPFINADATRLRASCCRYGNYLAGNRILSKVGIIFLGAVFPILINSRDGVKTTPLNLLNAARQLWCFRMDDLQSGRSPPSTIPFILQVV